VTEIKRPDGTTEEFEYNGLNLITKAVARDGAVTCYE
jgi:YD repeat-containing protein